MLYNTIELYRRHIARANIVSIFQEMKYNNSKKFELLHRQKNAINKLTKKEWTEAFKKKAIESLNRKCNNSSPNSPFF